MQVHPEAFLPLFNTILINVTGFFRDSLAWKYLQNDALPRLLEDKPQNSPLRIWSAGCASGEEAYSLAIVLAEILGLEQFRERVKLYATDADDDTLAQARYAGYSQKALKSIAPKLQEKYFETIGNKKIFRSDLRRSVIFGRHDLLRDAPISRLDLLVCRNTLMYFNAEAQTKIIDRFHFALNDTGILFMGKAEMLLTHAHLFSPISLTHRIFRRSSLRSHRSRLLPNVSLGSNPNQDLERRIRLQALGFDAVSEAQIIVDIQGYLVLANAAAQSLFDIISLDLGRPLQDLEVSYRPLELRSHIEQVQRKGSSLLIENVPRTLAPDNVQYFDVGIVPLAEQDGTLLGLSVTFMEISRYHKLKEELQQSSQNLETANEELESSNEELEATNEELQSTNEELETTNEELQSTNEELETINEELHSSNEELQTINDELRIRTTELNQANAFLKSVFASLNVGVIVVDRGFNILSWNHEAENLWGLRSEEVIGHSILGLDIGLPLDPLREPMRKCLLGEIDGQEIVLSAINRRGQTLKCRISFNSLSGLEPRLRGVILFMDKVN